MFLLCRMRFRSGHWNALRRGLSIIWGGGGGEEAYDLVAWRIAEEEGVGGAWELLMSIVSDCWFLLGCCSSWCKREEETTEERGLPISAPPILLLNFSLGDRVDRPGLWPSRVWNIWSCTAAQPLHPTSILLPAGLPWAENGAFLNHGWMEHGHGLLASVSSTPLALPRLTDFGRLSNCDKASLYELGVMAALRI